MSGYTQLTQGQRYQLEVLLKAGHNQTMIANILAIHKSTVSRELRRNRGLRGYRPKQAHEKAMQRRHEKAKTHIPLTTWVLEPRTNFRSACIQNKVSRSATNGFTSISIETNIKEVISINICVARRNVVSDTANKIAGDAFPTASALMNVQLLLPINLESATGKAIRLSVKDIKA